MNWFGYLAWTFGYLFLGYAIGKVGWRVYYAKKLGSVGKMVAAILFPVSFFFPSDHQRLGLPYQSDDGNSSFRIYYFTEYIYCIGLALTWPLKMAFCLSVSTVMGLFWSFENFFQAFSGKQVAKISGWLKRIYQRKKVSEPDGLERIRIAMAGLADKNRALQEMGESLNERRGKLVDLIGKWRKLVQMQTDALTARQEKMVRHLETNLEENSQAIGRVQKAIQSLASKRQELEALLRVLEMFDRTRVLLPDLDSDHNISEQIQEIMEEANQVVELCWLYCQVSADPPDCEKKVGGQSVVDAHNRFQQKEKLLR